MERRLERRDERRLERRDERRRAPPDFLRCVKRFSDRRIEARNLLNERLIDMGLHDERRRDERRRDADLDLIRAPAFCKYICARLPPRIGECLRAPPKSEYIVCWGCKTQRKHFYFLSSSAFMIFFGYLYVL